jgi:molybdopterin-guanine dinucleotide biosynthesis protein A
MASVADRVVVSVGSRSFGFEDEVVDVEGMSGPLAGIVAALRVTTGDHLGVVPVDAPGTDAQLLRRLADLCGAHGRSAAVVVADGHLQALHVVLARSAHAAIEARVAAGERSPRGLLAWLDALVVDTRGWDDLDPGAAMARDWDEPGDLPGGVLPGDPRTPGR